MCCRILKLNLLALQEVHRRRIRQVSGGFESVAEIRAVYQTLRRVHVFLDAIWDDDAVGAVVRAIFRSVPCWLHEPAPAFEPPLPCELPIHGVSLQLT